VREWAGGLGWLRVVCVRVHVCVVVVVVCVVVVVWGKGGGGGNNRAKFSSSHLPDPLHSSGKGACWLTRDWDAVATAVGNKGRQCLGIPSARDIHYLRK
jgi:hypothetical protein